LSTVFIDVSHHTQSNDIRFALIAPNVLKESGFALALGSITEGMTSLEAVGVEVTLSSKDSRSTLTLFLVIKQSFRTLT
jgi:hypothetical protein